MLDEFMLSASASSIDITIEHAVPGEAAELAERVSERLADDERARRALWIADSHQRERALLLWG